MASVSSSAWRNSRGEPQAAQRAACGEASVRQSRQKHFSLNAAMLGH
jgi:hypothetical protein